MKLSKKFDFSTKNNVVCFLGTNGVVFIDAMCEQKLYKVGVILPSLYYSKIETLPVSSQTKAKELAAAVFDGFLPASKNYKYCAKKISQNVFCLIAWNEDNIKLAIKQAGKEASKIIRWSFADAVLSDCVLKLDANRTLMFVDDLAQELPSSFTDTKTSELVTIKSELTCGLWAFNKPAINVSQRVLNISLIVLAICFLVQIVFYMSEWSRNIQTTELISQNIGAQNLESLKQEIKELDEIQKTQYDIRRTIGILKDMPNSARLESIKITDKKIDAVFHTVKPSELKAYLTPFKPEALVISGDTISLILPVDSK